MESHILHSTSYFATCCVSFAHSVLYILHSMSYVTRPTKSAQELRHFLNQCIGVNIQYNIPHSASYILHLILQPASYFQMCNILRCPVLYILNIVCSVYVVYPIYFYILDLAVHLTSYILRSASHFLPYDLCQRESSISYPQQPVHMS